jgi:hypothetical protein
MKRLSFVLPLPLREGLPVLPILPVRPLPKEKKKPDTFR